MPTSEAVPLHDAVGRQADPGPAGQKGGKSVFPVRHSSDSNRQTYTCIAQIAPNLTRPRGGNRANASSRGLVHLGQLHANQANGDLIAAPASLRRAHMRCQGRQLHEVLEAGHKFGKGCSENRCAIRGFRPWIGDWWNLRTRCSSRKRSVCFFAP